MRMLYLFINSDRASFFTIGGNHNEKNEKQDYFYDGYWMFDRRTGFGAGWRG